MYTQLCNTDDVLATTLGSSNTYVGCSGACHCAYVCLFAYCVLKCARAFLHACVCVRACTHEYASDHVRTRVFTHKICARNIDNCLSKYVGKYELAGTS